MLAISRPPMGWTGGQGSAADRVRPLRAAGSFCAQPWPPVQPGTMPGLRSGVFPRAFLGEISVFERGL